MAAFLLPCNSNLPDFTFQCELDAVTYQFHFRWDERELAWFMGILDVSGNALINGVRVVVGFPLAVRTRYNTAMPPGALIAFDTSGQDLDPGLTDLGSRVQILYYSVVEDGQ
jgi:hypothetical protein